ADEIADLRQRIARRQGEVQLDAERLGPRARAFGEKTLDPVGADFHDVILSVSMRMSACLQAVHPPERCTPGVCGEARRSFDRPQARLLAGITPTCGARWP